jgi:hypothetical protein
MKIQSKFKLNYFINLIISFYFITNVNCQETPEALATDAIDYSSCLEASTLSGEYNDDNVKTYNALIITKECPESTLFTLQIDKCLCDNIIAFYGGIKVDLFPKNDFKENEILTYGFYLKGKHFLGVDEKLEIIIDCIQGPKINTSKTFTITKLENGKYFEVINNSTFKSYCQIVDTLETKLCRCDKNITQAIRIEHSKTTHTTGNQIIVNGFGNWGPENKEFNYNVIIKNSFELTTNDAYNSPTQKNILLAPLDMNFCINPCLQVCYTTASTDLVEVRCGQPDAVIKAGVEKIIKGSFHTELSQCDVPFKNNQTSCPPISFNLIELKDNTTQLKSCIADIKVEVFSSDTDLKYRWIGPYGIKSDKKNLFNVPYGEYKLIITDQCCNTSVQEILLCDKKIELHEWIYDGLNDTWCNDFQCGDKCKVKNCKKADLKIATIENGICIEEHYFENKFLGALELGTADLLFSYDDFNKECVFKYTCNGVEKEIRKTADEEIWSYDDFWDKCFLDVRCDNSWFEEVNEVEPEITWTWNDFLEECKGDPVYCDEQEVESINQNPYEIYDWYAFAPFDCKRKIVCVSGGDELEDTGDLSTVEDGQDLFCDDPYEYYNIYCDGEFIIKICSEEDPGFNEDVPISRNKSKADIIYNNDNKNITIENVIYGKNNQIEIIDILSRSVYRKYLPIGEDQLNITTSAFQDGIYIISVISDNVRIARKKIVVF